MITNFLLSIAVLLLASFALGEVFERFGLDAVIGYLLAGLLLGPSILKLVNPHIVEDFALVGAVLILFMAGLKEENAAQIYTNKKAVSIGIALLLGTFAAVFITLFIMGSFNLMQIIFFALAFAVVDLGVPAKLFLSLGLLDTEYGRSALNAGVINILFGFSALVGLTLFFNPTASAIAMKLLGIGIFAGLFFGLHALINKISQKVALFESEAVQFTLAFVLVLFLAYLTEALGFSSILGAFLGGVVVARTRFASTQKFADSIKAISLGLFVPLFFGWFGLELMLWGPEGIIANIVPALILLAVAVSTKFIIAFVMSKRQKLKYPGIIAASVLSLDVESLVILLLALQMGVFVDKSAISIFAPAVPFTTLIISILFVVFRKKYNIKERGAKEPVPSSLHMHHYHKYLKKHRA